MPTGLVKMGLRGRSLQAGTHRNRLQTVRHPTGEADHHVQPKVIGRNSMGFFRGAMVHKGNVAPGGGLLNKRLEVFSNGL